jgi:hypothetical protein
MVGYVDAELVDTRVTFLHGVGVVGLTTPAQVAVLVAIAEPPFTYAVFHPAPNGPPPEYTYPAIVSPEPDGGLVLASHKYCEVPTEYILYHIEMV